MGVNTKDSEELLREHVDSEHGSHFDEPPQATTTIVHADKDRANVSQQLTSSSTASPANIQKEELLSSPSSPGILVLQWLTYAFWGWTTVALAFLVGISLDFYINGTAEYGMATPDSIAYSLSAVLVLLVISLVCDWFYSRREPVKKHGAAMVIMLIHAVLFALIAIGWLVTAVFSGVKMLLGASDGYAYSTDTSLTFLLTGIVMAIVVGVLLLRVLRMVLKARIPLIWWMVVTLTAIAFAVTGIVGPAMQTARTKNDRLIERSLPVVAEMINNYTAKHNKLPATLADVRGNLNSDGKKLIDEKMVEYKPGTLLENMQLGNPRVINPDQTPGSPYYPSEQDVIYRYELCVTYTAKKNIGRGGYVPSYYEKGQSMTSPDTYAHDKGYKCYDLQTSYSAYQGL